MKKSIFFCFVLLILLAQNISSQELGGLYTDRNAGFTMSMPRGWRTVDFNLGYLSIVGPEYSGITPNIGFGEDEYAGSVSEYIDALVSYFSLIFSNFRLLDRSNFRTNAGVVGESITYQGSMGAVTVRQKVYVFPNRRGNAVMVITATAPVTGGERFDTIFDASVRTFNWTR